MTKEPSYVSGESRTRGREGVVRRQGSQVDWAAGLVVMVLVLFFGVPLWMFNGNVQKPDSAIGRTPSAPPAASQPALNTPAEMSEQLQKDIYRSVWHEKEAWYAAQVWDWDRCPPASTPEPQLLSQIEPCATEVREAEQRLEEALQRQGVSRAQWREIETQAALNNWPPHHPSPGRLSLSKREKRSSVVWC